MRLAYADPPYPGQSAKHYGDHPDYAGEVDHRSLIEDMIGRYDGWALSTSNRALREVLSWSPPDVRILAWNKPIAPPMSGHGVYGWEPVIVSWARPPAKRDLRDTITVSPEQYTFRPKPDGYVTGSKPPAFCRWMFAWLGARPGDDFVDLFPGSGAVTRAWDAWSAQGDLLTLRAKGLPPYGWDLDNPPTFERRSPQSEDHDQTRAHEAEMRAEHGMPARSPQSEDHE